MSIRRCRDDERGAIFEIVNAAAERYRGVIPADRWHEPYMPREELDREIAAGVVFWGYEADGELAGVMGIQPVGAVVLIRHAYVRPTDQGEGIGGALLKHLTDSTDRPILIGTWAAAEWAIGFYRKHGFETVSRERKDELLKTYWNIPERQIETSVVLAKRDTMADTDLRARMEQFQRCIEERDRAAADAVLDEDYALVLVHPAPAVMPRERWIELLPEYRVDAYEVEHQHVDRGDDCACVLQRVAMQATFLGEDRSGTFVISDVWRRRTDGWRIWRRHSTPLAAGRLPGA